MARLGTLSLSVTHLFQSSPVTDEMSLDIRLYKVGWPWSKGWESWIPLVTGSAACSPSISLSEILALLNGVGNRAKRFGPASHSGELVPAGCEVLPMLSTEAANLTTTGLYELLEKEYQSIEMIPCLSTVRNQLSPPCRAVAVGKLRRGSPAVLVSSGYLNCPLLHVFQVNERFYMQQNVSLKVWRTLTVNFGGDTQLAFFSCPIFLVNINWEISIRITSLNWGAARRDQPWVMVAGESCPWTFSWAALKHSKECKNIIKEPGCA